LLFVKKRPHLAKKKVIFQHDNARPNTGDVTTKKVAELKYDVLPHPHFSPDLALSSCYLFPKLKKELGWRGLECNDDLEDFVNRFFRTFHKRRTLRE
jgi:histone-lysine N-methyltransferase SETMAR